MKYTCVALLSSTASITAVYYFERKKGYAILDSIEVLWNKVQEGFKAAAAVLLQPSLDKCNSPKEDTALGENGVEEDLNLEIPDAEKGKRKQLIIDETTDAETLVKVAISDNKGYKTDESSKFEKVKEKSKQEVQNNAKKDLDQQNIDPSGFNTKQTNENETFNASKLQKTDKPSPSLLVTQSPTGLLIPPPPPLPDINSTSCPALTLSYSPCPPVPPPSTINTPTSPYSRLSASQAPHEESYSKAEKFFQRWLQIIRGKKGKRWWRKFIIKNIFKKKKSVHTQDNKPACLPDEPPTKPPRTYAPKEPPNVPLSGRTPTISNTRKIYDYNPKKGMDAVIEELKRRQNMKKRNSKDMEIWVQNLEKGRKKVSS